jgi:hypothetical protein
MKINIYPVLFKTWYASGIILLHAFCVKKLIESKKNNMQKFVLIFTIGFLALNACQNTPKTASETATTNTQATETPAAESAPASPEALQQALTAANSSRELALSLRNQLDQLPAGVKSKNKALIDGFYNDIEGLMGKGSYMIGDMQRTSAGTGQEATATEDVPSSPVTQSVVKDYSESVERYNQVLRDMQQKIEALKSGN